MEEKCETAYGAERKSCLIGGHKKLAADLHFMFFKKSFICCMLVLKRVEQNIFFP